MKREDLKKLLSDAATDEILDKIMALHGSDIENYKTKLSTTETEVKGLKDQLKDANTQIESFKSMDIEAIKKAATDWEAKAKQAETDAAAKVAALKFDHALDGALGGAKAKNPKAVKALLNMEGLKFNDADGSIVGLKEQLETVKKDNAYLFNDETQPPTIVAGATPPVTSDAFTAALRKGAGLTTEQGK